MHTNFSVADKFEYAELPKRNVRKRISRNPKKFIKLPRTADSEKANFTK